MLTSIDVSGRIVASKISVVAFGIMSVDKITIVKERGENYNLPLYQVLSCRFYNAQFKSQEAA